MILTLERWNNKQVFNFYAFEFYACKILNPELLLLLLLFYDYYIWHSSKKTKKAKNLYIQIERKQYLNNKYKN